MIKDLDIRFPVAEIQRRTGIGKSQISATLSGKIPMSDSFYKKFKESFKKDKEELVFETTTAALSAMVRGLRHTFAVMWLNRGGSIETISKLLGHTSLKTTMIYSKITNKRIEEEVGRVFR